MISEGGCTLPSVAAANALSIAPCPRIVGDPLLVPQSPRGEESHINAYLQTWQVASSNWDIFTNQRPSAPTSSSGVTTAHSTQPRAHMITGDSAAMPHEDSQISPTF